MEGNHYLTFNFRFKNIKSINSVTSCPNSKPMVVAFFFPVFLADIYKNYGHEKEMDRKLYIENSVSYMEYVYFIIKESRK